MVFSGPRCSSNTTNASWIRECEGSLCCRFCLVMVFIVLLKLKRSNNAQRSLVAFEHSIITGEKEINLSRFCACKMHGIKRLQSIFLYNRLCAAHNVVGEMLICGSKIHH